MIRNHIYCSVLGSLTCIAVLVFLFYLPHMKSTGLPYGAGPSVMGLLAGVLYLRKRRPQNENHDFDGPLFDSLSQSTRQQIRSSIHTLAICQQIVRRLVTPHAVVILAALLANGYVAQTLLTLIGAVLLWVGYAAADIAGLSSAFLRGAAEPLRLNKHIEESD